MAQPLYRLTISRKDGEPMKFKDYRGETVEKKHKPIGAVFQGDEGRLFVSAKEPFRYDPEEHWLNIFAVETNEDDKPAPRKGKKSAAKKPADDETDPFDD